MALIRSVLITTGRVGRERLHKRPARESSGSHEASNRSKETSPFPLVVLLGEAGVVVMDLLPRTNIARVFLAGPAPAAGLMLLIGITFPFT